MPKILSSTPEWLCRPFQAFNLFHQGPQRKQSINSAQYNTTEYHGPHRLIAKRGTEIFAVVNNQIRWADLCILKCDFELFRENSRRKSRRSRSFTPDGGDPNQDERDDKKGKGYRVLNAGSIPQIRQLIASPDGDLLAILTSHTVHIAILPDPSHLNSRDEGPIRLKTHQLGPTTHVIPESPVMSALWHPLGVDKSTLVTVTADAAVRIWELRRENSWSFDQPTLAIDLKKLVDGTSSDDKFEPAAFGTNKGFSPDEMDMEVASASFGGLGLDEEDGWAPMTLWVVMRNRDLYALCPLLPSKWQPTATIIPSLSTNVVSQAAVLRDDPLSTDVERKICDQQYRWFSEIDNQEPVISTSNAEIYTRPTSIGPIPKLQGPYAFDFPEGSNDDYSEVTDILVIAAKVDAVELLQGEDDDADSFVEDLMGGGVSTTLICLVTETGKVFICMDLEGVQGLWLPKLRHKAFAIPSNPVAEITLVSVESLTQVPVVGSDWPLFTQGLPDRYEFFISSLNAVESFSISDWAERLEKELSCTNGSGLAFRLKLLCSPDTTVVTKETLLLNNQPDNADADVRSREGKHLNASLVFDDLTLGGYFLLTSNASRPMAVLLDTPSTESNVLPSIEEHQRSVTPAKSPSPAPLQLLARPCSPYQPPQIFYANTPLTNFIESHVPARDRQVFKRDIRLSPATLDVMTAAHRILSQETSKLESAAADLFRRCERLRTEMKDQIQRLRYVAEKVEHIVDDGSGDEDDDGDGFEKPETKKVDRRLNEAKRRQGELAERFEALRKKLGRGLGKDLSDKEKAWKGEIERLKTGVLNDDEDGEEGEKAEEANFGRRKGRRTRNEDELLWKRFETVESLSSDLLTQVKTMVDTMYTKTSKGIDTNAKASPSRRSTTQLSRVPSKIQKARVSEAMGMVEREAAIIDSLTARLGRLTTGSNTGI